MAKTPNIGLHQWQPQDNFLRTDFNEDFGKIDTALGAVTAAAAGVNATLTTHGAKLDEVNTALEGQATRLGGIDTALSTQAAKLTGIDTTLTTHDSKLTGINTTLGTHTTKLGTVDTTLGSHTTRLNGIDSTLATHNTKLENINTVLLAQSGLVWGSYVGTAPLEPVDNSTNSGTISLGFTPKLVLVISHESSSYSSNATPYISMVTQATPLMAEDTGQKLLSIVSNGFMVGSLKYQGKIYYPKFNDSRVTYIYLAVK